MDIKYLTHCRRCGNVVCFEDFPSKRVEWDTNKEPGKVYYIPGKAANVSEVVICPSCGTEIAIEGV